MSKELSAWKMIRRPLVVFIALLALVFTGALAFVQSERFAQIVKKSAARLIPGDLGVDGDFSDFSLSIFPPSLSVNRPSLRLRERNILGLPEGSQVSAEQIRLVFRLFQSLSGSISVDRVVVEGGEIDLKISTTQRREKTKKKKEGLFESWMQGRLGIHWEDLLRVRAESIELENTHLRLALVDAKTTLDIDARALRLSRSEGVSVSNASKGFPFPLLNRKFAHGWNISLDLGALIVEAPAQGLPSWVGSMRTKMVSGQESFVRIEGFSQVRADAFLDAFGLRLDRLAFERNGLGVDIRGQVVGDLLAPMDDLLALDIKTEVSGDLQRILQELDQPTAKKPQVQKSVGSGSLSMQLAVQGNLLDLERTAKVQGQIRGRTLKWGPWSADRLEVEGAWEAKPATDWGVFEIQRAALTAAEEPRFGVLRPGRGGEIRTQGVRWIPGDSKEWVLPLTLERVHIHWLAAAALNQVWPLDFRVSGTTQLTVSPPDPTSRRMKGWSALADLKLGIDRFVLDNQKPGRFRKRKVILDIPQLNLRGGVRVDTVGIHSEGFRLVLPKSELRAEGRVDFKEGFRLNVSGPVQLGDIGMLAEVPIRGEGTLSAHIHGPTSRVLIDFDPDLMNASYLNLKFGHLRGRLTYDEDPQHLLIPQLKAEQRSLSYKVSGQFDLGDAETVNLDADIISGDINDFNEIFTNLTQEISWYPRTLTGGVTGKIKLSGGIDLSRLVIDGRLRGENWSYWGENFQEVALRGGYDRGKYQIEEFRALKKKGKLSGNISWKEQDGIVWSIRSEGFSLGDFDSVARLDVPIRGRLSLNSSGSGLEGKVISSTRIQVTEAGIRGNVVPPSELKIDSAGGRATWDGVILGGQGRINAVIDEAIGATSQVKLDLVGLDYSPILLLLNPKLMQDRELRGLVSAAIQVSYPNARPDKVSGVLELTQFELARTGIRFELKQPRSVALTQGEFSLEGLTLLSSRGQSAQLSVQSRGGRLEGLFAGKLDLGILEFATPAVEKAQGDLEFDLAVGGELIQPSLSGRVDVGEVGILSRALRPESAVSSRVKVSALETPIENVSGTLVINKGRVVINQLSGELAGGSLSASGEVEVFPDRWPALNLGLELSGNKVKIWPFQYIKTRGKLTITGASPPWVIAGTLEVDDALSKEKFSSGANTGASGSLVRYSPPPGSGADTQFPKFVLDVAVNGSRGLFVKNDLFDAEIAGKLRLINTLDAPRIIGSAQVVRGNMIFRDRVFQIQSASADFDNPALLDPKLNLAGSTEVSGTRINLSVTGRTSRYQVDFTSNPVLPESEILSLLALGFTNADIQRLKAGDRSTVEQSEAASLVLHSTDFNRDLESKTGLRIQIDEAVQSDVGSSIFRPRSETEVGTAPKIVIKRQLGKRVDVSVGSTVGVGTNSQQEVNAEFKVTPSFSVIGVWDTLEGADSQARESYGVDLKVQKRFK